MKKISVLFLLVLFVVSAYAQDPSLVLKKDHKIDSTKVIVPDEFYKRERQIILSLLSVYHYKKQQLNDSLSSVIFNEYLKSMDVTKSYFLKSDIDQVEKYRFMFDDMIRNGSLEIPFQIFNVFKNRVNERVAYVKKVLQKEFDFTVNETFKPDREKAEWAKTEEELNEIWRLRLKNDALSLVLSNKDAKKVYSDLLKRYQNFHKVVLQYEAEDVFSIYINSVTQTLDPHTDYFSPVNSDNFSIAMKLSLEGIGAQLRQEGDYTTVAVVVPGGPVQKSNLLHEEDRIVGVAQLPTFYTDFEGQRTGKPDYKSTTRDVRALISKFKEEKVDGIIMDLRGNGGGSLQEAIQLTGLFIKEGPVVQVKDARQQIEVDRDPDPTILYDGPFAVLVDRSSASASEIFAAAIQDYGRGVIIGEKTWGKGTVQNMIDLGMMIRTEGKKAGQIKLTQAKFYRINGSSTQRKGVSPDILFPSRYEIDEFGEEARPSALAWDQIPSSDYVPYMNISSVIPELEAKHEARAQKDPEFQLVIDEIKDYKKAREQKEFSLNKEVRKAERDEAEAARKKREDERMKILGIKIEDKKEVTPAVSKESDYDLKETGRILADLILSKNKLKLVTTD